LLALQQALLKSVQSTYSVVSVIKLADMHIAVTYPAECLFYLASSLLSLETDTY